MAKTAPVYENSAQDRSNDRKAAKALGKTVNQFEGSAADQVMDAKGQQGLNRAAANSAGPDVKPVPQGAQPHTMAFKRPLS